ncbi:NERD domain-containing protein [Dorea sp. OM02-2LB]|nr:NERD domain-containing protein [Dorea sp. OM02-2LB]
MGEDKAQYVRISEVLSRCECLARENNLYFDPKVRDGIQALRVINKEIAVAMAGKCAEDRVAKTFQYVMRSDANFFRNVYLSDGENETELDAVVITKNGFLILEVKNAKEDITIAPDGRSLFNNSSCYHDISIGEKMDRKRRLLRKRLEREFADRGIQKEIKIDSLLVFSTVRGVKIQVHDQFKKEKYCFRGSLINRIDSFESSVEYSEKEMAVINEIFQQIETEQKRFTLTFQPEVLKRKIAEAFEILLNGSGVNQEKSIKKVNPFMRWIKKYSTSVAKAS